MNNIWWKNYPVQIGIRIMELNIHKNTNYKNKHLYTSEIHNLVGNIMVYQKLSLMIYYMATPTIFHATKVSFLLCVMYNWWFH